MEASDHKMRHRTMHLHEQQYRLRWKLTERSSEELRGKNFQPLPCLICNETIGERWHFKNDKEPISFPPSHEEMNVVLAWKVSALHMKGKLWSKKIVQQGPLVAMIRFCRQNSSRYKRQKRIRNLETWKLTDEVSVLYFLGLT